MIKKAKKISSNKISQIHTGVLVLENKTIFKGVGIGYQGTATGEVCFNTSLTGYQEIISDPSYAGQIINFTFPHVGNVGTNKEDLESDKVCPTNCRAAASQPGIVPSFATMRRSTWPGRV